MNKKEKEIVKKIKQLVNEDLNKIIEDLEAVSD